MILIIDSDNIMAECIKREVIAAGVSENDVLLAGNALEAMPLIEDNIEHLKLIFLDVMLDGPDGFTLLNELASYNDTAKIPVVLVTALKIKADLADYHIVKILDKSKMQPKDIREVIKNA